MGRIRHNPSTRRFADLPHEPCVYVAETSCGVIKVGVGGSARARMMALANEFRREYGADLLRFHIVPKPTTKAAYETETVLVRLLMQVGELVPGRREHFTGVTFEFARDLSNAVIGQAYKQGQRTTVKPVYGRHFAQVSEAA